MSAKVLMALAVEYETLKEIKDLAHRLSLIRGEIKWTTMVRDWLGKALEEAKKSESLDQ